MMWCTILRTSRRKADDLHRPAFYCRIAALSCLLWLCGAEAAEEQLHVDESPAADSAPVTVDGVELFRVAGAASLPGEQRAENVRIRIIDLARDARVSAEAVSVEPREDRLDVVADGRHIVAVIGSDAALESAPASAVAEARAFRIQRAIERYRAERRPDYLARAALFAFLSTAATIAALFLTLRVFRRLQSLVRGRFHGRVRSVRIRSYEVVRAESIWRALDGVLGLLRLLLVVTLIYVYLTLTLRRFPWTRGLAERLLDLILDPLARIGEAILGYIPKLVFLVVLVLAVRYLLKAAGLFFRAVGAGTLDLPGFDADWAQPTHNIVRALIILLSIVVAYPYLPGSGSAAFQGVSIFAGLVLSLGASSAMSNIIAGYTVTYRRAFRPGDRIAIGEFTGDVTDIRLLVTHLRTPKNEEVVVPNSLVLQSQVVNYSRLAKTQGLILHTTVGIGYETPWRQVEAMLLAAAERTSGLLREPRAFVLESSLGDFAVAYELNVYVDSAGEMLERYAALHRNILDVFNEHGVQIMTPAYESDPDQPKLVPVERWYDAPARQTPNDSAQLPSGAGRRNDEGSGAPAAAP